MRSSAGRNMVRRIRALLLLCLLFVLGVAAARAQDSDPRVVTAQPSTRAVSLTAFTRAGTVMTLVSELAGKVLSVHADVGDAIDSSGVFARIDDTFTRLELDKVLVQQEKLRSNIAYYSKEASRFQELVKRDSAAQSQLDELELNLALARHELEGQKVEEQRLREQLERFIVVAPPHWEVMERYVEPGEWINTGEKVAELGDFRVLVAPFGLSPEEFYWLKDQNGTVTLTAPDVPEGPQAVQAQVGRISPGFNPETRKIHVELEIPAAPPLTRGGQRVELSMRLPEARDT
ncbi:MAG: efflux RND transporter periplasmic adaptor subunit, partial [Oceanidesulfovibrio sp.]